MERYADTVWRLCLIHLKNRADAEDVFQTVFLKYVLSTAAFESDEHEKAWFIRVTVNACRDLLRSFFRSRTVPLDELADLLIVSQAEVSPDVTNIQVEPAEGRKCERCWKVLPTVGSDPKHPTLCPRCARVVPAVEI